MVRTNSNVNLNDSCIFATRIQSKISEGRVLRACRTIFYSTFMKNQNAVAGRDSESPAGLCPSTCGTSGLYNTGCGDGRPRNSCRRSHTTQHAVQRAGLAPYFLGGILVGDIIARSPASGRRATALTPGITTYRSRSGRSAGAICQC